MPEEVVTVQDVLVDDRGREFSTFREQLAAHLAPLAGHRARIEYHEEQRGGFTNVYLDRVEPLPDQEAPEARDAAWQMAIEAAPLSPRLRCSRDRDCARRVVRETHGEGSPSPVTPEVAGSSPVASFLERIWSRMRAAPVLQSGISWPDPIA